MVRCQRCGGDLGEVSAKHKYCADCLIVQRKEARRRNYEKHRDTILRTGKDTRALKLKALRCARCGNPITNAKTSCKKYCDDCHKIVRKEDHDRYHASRPGLRKKWKKEWDASHHDENLEYNKRWAKEHPEAIKERRRRLYARERDAIIAKQKTYYNAHRDAALRYQLKYYEDNRDRILVRYKEYRRNNRKLLSFRCRRSHLKRKNVIGRHTVKEFHQLCEIFDWKCAYCDKQLDVNNVTEDHVISIETGGTDFIDNILPCCSRCNSRKKHYAFGNLMLRYMNTNQNNMEMY